jgi:hypothetical protein
VCREYPQNRASSRLLQEGICYRILYRAVPDVRVQHPITGGMFCTCLLPAPNSFRQKASSAISLSDSAVLNDALFLTCGVRLTQTAIPNSRGNVQGN